MVGLRKRAAKRLKVSTGEERSAGATSGYGNKLRRAQRKATSVAKTDEEKQLEEQLFGLSYSNEQGEEDEGAALDWLSQNRHELNGSGTEEGSDGDADVDTGLSGVADDQLFFTDAPGPSSRSYLEEPASADSGEEDEASEGEASDGDDEEIDSVDSQQKDAAAKKPLWFDPADANLTVSLQDSNRRRKLRTSAAEDIVTGSEYELKLREQFRKIHPTPAWATKARLQKQKGKQADGNTSDESDDDEDSTSKVTLNQILQSSNAGIQKLPSSSTPLPSGQLDVQRLRDANHVDKGKSPITTLQFHPSAQVLYTTSEDRRLKLFQVDGSHNTLLQSVHVPELPITSSSFHPSGSSILLTGQRPFFYSFDLQAGRIIRSPRGLWSSGLGGSDRQTNDRKGGSMELFKFSPDGRLVAVAGRRGYVHLLDWGTDGKGMMAGGNGGQMLGQVKINTGIKGLSWNANGTELVTVGDDDVIYSWDIGTKKCISRWSDTGGFAPTIVETDKSERYFAIGSRSGIVNLYDNEAAFNSGLPDFKQRTPLKSIMNLTTSVTSMRYNHSSEILALASRNKADSLKLVHLGSGSVFSNWPTSGTPLGHVSAVDFSRGSEYIAIGNHKGRVLLYSLGHYIK